MSPKTDTSRPSGPVVVVPRSVPPTPNRSVIPGPVRSATFVASVIGPPGPVRGYGGRDDHIRARGQAASRSIGQLMQRGPPRPRPSSPPGTSSTSMPWRRRKVLVVTLRS